MSNFKITIQQTIIIKADNKNEALETLRNNRPYLTFSEYDPETSDVIVPGKKVHVIKVEECADDDWLVICEETKNV